MKHEFFITIFFVFSTSAYIPRFVFIVPAYNARPWIRKNLDSLLGQRYPGYRVIIIDDASIDGTAEFIKKYVEKFDTSKRVTFLKNSERRGQLANVYRAVHSCADDEIAFIVDADDWLINKFVLSYMSMIYKQQKPWVTHGNFIYYAPHAKNKRRLHETECNVRPYPYKVLKKTSIREYQRKTSHIATRVRTFYAGLFKQIRTKDLLYQDFFYQAASDPAYMVPMIEMAGPKKVYHISKSVYIYNLENPLSYHARKGGVAFQVKMMKNIWQKQPYTRLKKIVHKEKVNTVDIICFSENDQLLKILQDVQRTYGKVKHILFLDKEIVSFENNGFAKKEQLLTYLRSLNSSHLLFIDEIKYFTGIDLNQCFQFFTQAKADIIYFSDQTTEHQLEISPHFVAKKPYGKSYGFFVKKDWLTNALEKNIPIEGDVQVNYYTYHK